jgi:hypothetical protein
MFKDLIMDNLFHFHSFLNPKELILEISKYDFGFWTTNPVEGESIESNFATGNKLASYLEAGIPFLHNEKFSFLDRLTKKYDISIPFNDKDLKGLGKRLQRINWRKMQKKIIAAREELNMEKNFPRLEEFVKEVVGDFERKNKKLKINQMQ